MWIRIIAAALMCGSLVFVSGASAKPPAWQNCGVVRVHGNDEMLRLKVVRIVKQLKCKSARSLIQNAWRLPKPHSGEVRPPLGWVCDVVHRDDGGFCGRAGAKTWILMAYNPAHDGQTTYVPAG
jgi:hypothetical protein